MYPVYFFYTVRMRTYQVRQSAEAFCKCKRIRELLNLLQQDKRELDRMADLPGYRTFFIPKEEEGVRKIEAPDIKLKNVQSLLNFYLQCVYHILRPESSYGFTMTTKDDPFPRTIYTNAQHHLGAEYVLNLDLKDFFHTIPIARVKSLFEEKPFRFTEKAADLLARLCTYQGRLPMGAPTSPIISNLVCLDLDHKIEAVAKKHGWKFTRYADDITLSSATAFGEDHVARILEVITSEGFEPHTEKLRHFHRNDPPVVTGLLLKEDAPDVSPELIEEIGRGLRFLKLMLAEPKYSVHPAMRSPMMAIRRSVQGQINFVAYIRGRQDKAYRSLQKKLDDLRIPEAA